MAKERTSRSMRSVLAAGSVLVIAIAGAISVILIRFENASGSIAAATGAERNVSRSAELTAIFAEQRLSMFRYLATAAPLDLAAAHAAQAQFTGLAVTVKPGTLAAKTALARVVINQAAFYAAFQKAVPLATARPSHAAYAVGPLDSMSPTVTVPLRQLANA